jgi:hypothetical protein
MLTSAGTTAKSWAALWARAGAGKQMTSIAAMSTAIKWLVKGFLLIGRILSGDPSDIAQDRPKQCLQETRGATSRL